MKFPLWLTLLLFVCWTVWVANDYFCEQCGCCSPAPAPPPVKQPVVSPLGAPVFSWSNPQAEIGNNFAQWKANIVATGKKTDTLNLIGYYRKEEVNHSSYENLGVARAITVKALMSPEIPAERIKVSGKLISDSMKIDVPQESLWFSWNKKAVSNIEGKIIEDGNTVTILYDYNSTNRLDDAEVFDFLQKFCQTYKAGLEHFTITGHTDNLGGEGRNQQVGLDRANIIRQVLRDCGIDRERITVASKGELEPVEDNATERGRKKNRRVVISIDGE